MKKYVSVFQMFVRTSFYKVMLIMIAMAGVSGVSFYLNFQKYQGDSLEQIIDASALSWIWKIAYILITLVLVLPGCNWGSEQDYTYKRLCIKASRVYLLQRIYYIGAYVLLWMVELAVLMIASAYYANVAQGVTNQTVFLAFYGNAFMHSILPLEDVISWIILAYLLIGTGYAAEAFCRKQRIGKFGALLIVMVALMLLAFPRELGGQIVFIGFVWAIQAFGFVFQLILEGGARANERK